MNINKFYLITFLTLLSLLASGCSSYKTVRIIHNGGDAPPFVNKSVDNNIHIEQLNAGDTVALVQGNVERLLKSNETTVYMMTKGGNNNSTNNGASKSKNNNKDRQSKSQRKSEDDEDTRSKSQRKSEENKDTRSKSQRKADNDEDYGSKNADKGSSKSESKKPHAQIHFAKYVRLSNQSQLSNHQNKLQYNVTIKHNEDPDNVIFSLALANYGDVDFQGSVSIVDHLPEGLEFLSTRSVLKRSYNTTKLALAFVPIVGLFTNMLLPDYSDTLVRPESIGVVDQSKASIVRYDLPNLKLEPNQQIVFDFLVKTPAW